MNRQRKAQAGRQELAEAVAYRQGGTQPTLDEDQVQDENRSHARQAQLFGERREDEIRVSQRDKLWVSAAPPGAHEAAGRLAEEALHELVGAVLVDVGIQGAQPDVEACLDVAERVNSDGHGGHEQRKTDDEPGHSVRGHIQHGDEQAEEQQGGSQVALEHEDGDADHPHHHDRAEVASARQAHAQELASSDGQVVAVRHQVARKEDGQRDLH